MCEGWSSEKLHNAIERQAKDEMHHAEWLIQPILYGEGASVVSKLKAIRIGKDAEEIIGTDQTAEEEAVSRGIWR